jgi:Uma2 family endonuclease
MMPGRRLTAPEAVVYPESDGKPMAESELHQDEMVRIIQTLRLWFEDDPLIHVAGNQLLYWEEGNPRLSIAPDVYVIKGLPKWPPLRTYKLWEVKRPPAVVIEVTSSTTRREDLGRKRRIYADLGVPEYFLFDPLGDYLKPPLQGFRLAGGGYEPIVPEPDGSLVSEELHLRLTHTGTSLSFFDRDTGERLLDAYETRDAARAEAVAEATARRLAEERLQAEIAARHEAEVRALAEADARRALEAELAALRARLGERNGPKGQ